MLNEDAYVSDEEELECPLCMEEFDISDRTFKPCPCGYQICRFCYNRIVNSETANGCPACRRQYTEETVEFKPLSAEEWKKDQQRIHSRKLKEKEKRESEMASRRHLSNMRVVQKNLVYVIGFSPKSADADLAATLRGNDYFAQYGKINKIVVNKKSHPNGQPTVGVYITYAKKEDAARAVQAVDNTMNDGRVLRASFGTTKYCSAYLRQQVCQNPNCMYLHEPGEDLDSYTREDMSTIQHAAKAAEGMHANALAAHHMRRQPSRADSSVTSNLDDSNTVALPPTASWASMPKPSEGPSVGETNPSISVTGASDYQKPDTLPAPSEKNGSQGEIPPPPSQAMEGSVHPSDLLPPPVQPGLNHPYLGNTLKTFFEGRFNFNFVPRVMPGLTEADVKSAENFPQLFSWNPEIRRPVSPSKNGKNHGRSGSRYAFAAESKTPPPGFVPPGLATGLQPPGFSGGGASTSKDSSNDFLSQFLRNASSTEAPGLAATSYEDPAILGLREFSGDRKGNSNVVVDAPNMDFTSDQGQQLDALLAIVQSSPTEQNFPDMLGSRSVDLGPPVPPAPGLSISDLEKPQSKFGASFAKLEHLENQAQEIAYRTDQKARSTWEPTSRPRDAGPRLPPPSLEPISTKALETLPNALPHPKSSGTWQPSPPPPKIPSSPSPKPISAAPQKFGTLKNLGKIPWEPSPPPTMNRAGSPLKNNFVSSVGLSPQAPSSSASAAVKSSQTVQPAPLLAEDDFPALRPASQVSEVVTPSVHTPAKKTWDPVAPVAVTPISPSVAPRTPTSVRRDSTQSTTTSLAEGNRSRKNSAAEMPTRIHTPRELSPAASPTASRAASPMVTPTLNRAVSALSAVPSISSPLASLNTGKQIRIVSSKTADDAKAKIDKAAAEERAIKKIKEEEAAAAAKSSVRKSVPLASVKKTKEQRMAEQREKAEKRERESIVSSQPEESTAQPAEIAPIIGRARKQKNKQPAIKTPVKAQSKVPTTTVVADDAARDSDANEAEDNQEPERPTTTNSKTAAYDAIAALATEVDLKSFKFFQAIPGLSRNFDFSAAELKQAADLTTWPTYTIKESVEQLERLLTAARKEANESLKAVEKCQKRNIKFARLDMSVNV